MQPGDLIQLRMLTRAGITWRKPVVLGILLEPPKFPRYGNYPKNYTVLTSQGVKTFTDRSLQVFERVPEDENAAR